jgi:thiol-disulfide isomerase/thioredoxin
MATGAYPGPDQMGTSVARERPPLSTAIEPYPGIIQTDTPILSITKDFQTTQDPFPDINETAIIVSPTPTMIIAIQDPYPGPGTPQPDDIDKTQTPNNTLLSTLVGAYPAPGSTDTPIATSQPTASSTLTPNQTQIPIQSATVNALITPIVTPTASPTPVIVTPTLSPTPSPSPMPSPTPTWTPIVLPPWMNTQLRATDPSTVQLVANKVQLIWFFAFWDGPSQAMAPIVHGIEEEYGELMNFIYLDIDDPDTEDLKAALFYRRQPHYFLVNRQGEVMKEWQGYVTSESLLNAIIAALQ